jgi:hypothetical protein
VPLIANLFVAYSEIEIKLNARLNSQRNPKEQTKAVGKNFDYATLKVNDVE